MGVKDDDKMWFMVVFREFVDGLVWDEIDDW